MMRDVSQVSGPCVIAIRATPRIRARVIIRIRVCARGRIDVSRRFRFRRAVYAPRFIRSRFCIPRVIAIATVHRFHFGNLARFFKNGNAEFVVIPRHLLKVREMFRAHVRDTGRLVVHPRADFHDSRGILPIQATFALDSAVLARDIRRECDAPFRSRSRGPANRCGRRAGRLGNGRGRSRPARLSDHGPARCPGRRAGRRGPHVAAQHGLNQRRERDAGRPRRGLGPAGRRRALRALCGPLTLARRRARSRRRPTRARLSGRLETVRVTGRERPAAARARGARIVRADRAPVHRDAPHRAAAGAAHRVARLSACSLIVGAACRTLGKTDKRKHGESIPESAHATHVLTCFALPSFVCACRMLSRVLKQHEKDAYRDALKTCNENRPANRVGSPAG